MGKILAAISRALKAAVTVWMLVPVAFAGGVQLVLQAFKRPSGDVENVVRDAPDPFGEQAVVEDRSRSVYRGNCYLGELPKLPETLGERMKEAAQYRLDDFGWQFLLENVSAYQERDWLGQRTPGELRLIARTAPAAIEAHLDGTELVLGLGSFKRKPGVPFELPEPAPDPVTSSAPVAARRSEGGGGRKKPKTEAKAEADDGFDVEEDRRLMLAEEFARTYAPTR